MKTVELTWVGQSKKGNYYLRVEFEENGFFLTRFIRITEEKAKEYEGKEHTKVEVPSNVLS